MHIRWRRRKQPFQNASTFLLVEIRMCCCYWCVLITSIFNFTTRGALGWWGVGDIRWRGVVFIIIIIIIQWWWWWVTILSTIILTEHIGGGGCVESLCCALQCMSFAAQHEMHHHYLIHDSCWMSRLVATPIAATWHQMEPGPYQTSFCGHRETPRGRTGGRCHLAEGGWRPHFVEQCSLVVRAEIWSDYYCCCWY